MATNIELFGSNSSDVVLPSEKTTLEGNATREELKSPDVKEAIIGEKVKTLLIPEKYDIITPNYVLDFRDCDKVADFQLKALASLVTKTGGTQLYVIVKNGMELIGRGDTELLNDVLALGMQKIFGDKCKVYKDVERDKPVQRVIVGDPNSFRLNI